MSSLTLGIMIFLPLYLQHLAQYYTQQLLKYCIRIEWLRGELSPNKNKSHLMSSSSLSASVDRCPPRQVISDFSHRVCLPDLRRRGEPQFSSLFPGEQISLHKVGPTSFLRIYFVDLFLVSPVVLSLSLSAPFQNEKHHKAFL